jgi:hypothetical protein
MKKLAAAILAATLGCASTPTTHDPSAPVATIPGASASAAPSASPSASASASATPAPASWVPPAVVSDETLKQNCMGLLEAIPQSARPQNWRVAGAADTFAEELKRRVAESPPPGMTAEQVKWCADGLRRGVAEHLQQSIDAEAKNALRRIAKSMIVAYEREQLGPEGSVIVHKLCPPAKAIPDALAKLAPQYASTNADWMKDAGWSCLKFEMSAPQRFQYEVRVDAGKSFVAYARRTTDDGAVEYSLGGEVKNDALVLWPDVKEKRTK